MSQQNGGWGQPPGGGYPPQGGYGQQPGGYGPPPGGGYGPPPGGGYGPPGGGYGPPGGGFGAPPPGGGFVPPGPMATGLVVAWEDPSLSFLGKWWGTVKESALPSRAFGAKVATSAEAMPAVTFSLSVFALFGLLVGVFVGVMYAAMGGFAAMAGGKSAGPIGAMMAGMGIGMAILYPLMFAAWGFVGPWISGGIHHLLLMMMSGASKPYSSSVRVAGYSNGTYLWSLIPCVGGVVAFVMSIIQNILGLDETHRCGTGKAAAAVLIPIVVGLLCFCGSYGTMIALVMGAAPHSTSTPYHP